VQDFFAEPFDPTEKTAVDESAGVDADASADADVSAASPVEPDAVLLAAVDLARAALLEITPASTIGGLVGHVAHEQHVLSLHFECLMPGYPDWHWTATLSRIDENSEPNVLETELLPGETAVLAPEWTPWSDRLEDYKLAQEHAAALADDESDDDESDDDDLEDDDLDLDDHILDDDVLDDAVHEHAESADSDELDSDESDSDESVLDASVLVRADDEPADSDAAGSESTSVDVDEEGLTVITFGDDEPRSSIYYDEDAPEELR
jgi:hypothetical protein